MITYRVPVDGGECCPDLTARHARHHLAALRYLVDLHGVGGPVIVIIKIGSVLNNIFFTVNKKN